MAETVFNISDDGTIPSSDRPYIYRLRRFLNDTEVYNELTNSEESSNLALYEALQDALDEINSTGNTTYYTTFSQVPWNLLKIGAALNVLASQGILSARNQLSYNDSGGIQVTDFDKYGRYINWFNVLVSKYIRGITQWKLSKNVEDAYGGVPSEYRDLGEL